jgi:hypothetical protein
MNEKNKHQNEEHLDRLLDSLLTSYSQVQPRPGLEQRVLSNVRARAQQERPQQRWSFASFVGKTTVSQTIFGGTLAAAVATILIMIMNYARPVPPPTPLAIYWQQPPLQQTVAKAYRPQPLSAARHKLQRHTSSPVAVAAADARQQVFPTPVPLSEQEQLMYHYLVGTPRQELVAQARPDRQLDQLEDQLEALHQPEEEMPVKDTPSREVPHDFRNLNITR